MMPRVNWVTLGRCTPRLLLYKTLPPSVAQMIQTPSLTLSSEAPVPLQVDGEMIGHLPATFAIEKQRLRVIGP
jgi:diacylglycerol kinase family enzyme